MTLPFFLIPILVGLVTQASKPFLNRHFYAQLEAEGRKVPRYGGMPSAHSAFAFSLATVVLMIDGIYSTTFVIAAAGLIAVLDDALRMRIFLSSYGQALHRLVERLPAEERAQFPYIEARLGHKVQEVIVGGLIGVVLSILIVSFLRS